MVVLALKSSLTEKYLHSVAAAIFLKGILENISQLYVKLPLYLYKNWDTLHLNV